MKEKKVFIIIIILLVLVVLFFPKREIYNDGGTKRYKALTYEITKYHELLDANKNYKTGVTVKILGYTVYEKIKFSDDIKENISSEKILKINNSLYYEVPSESTDFDSCGNEYYDGKIENSVDFSLIPYENNSSNFGMSFTYQFVSNNVVRICPDNNTIYFKRKKEDQTMLENVSDGLLDINSDFVNYLYERVNPSTDASILKGLYRDKFSNDYILSVGIVNLIREKNLRDEEYISQKDVEEEIHKILGYNISFTHQDVYVYSTDEFGKGTCGYWYRPNAKQYQLMHGCGGNWFEFFRRKLISAEKKENFVYLTEKSIYFYNDWDDYSSKRYVYSNYNKEKLLDYIEKPSSEIYQIELDNYLQDATTYTYVFKKNNDDYILEKVIKSK